MNVSENIPTSTPSVSSISLTGRAAPESPEDVVLDDERAGPGSETDTRRSHKSFYFAGAISCIIVVTLIGAVLAILLTNKPPVQVRSVFLLPRHGRKIPPPIIYMCYSCLFVQGCSAEEFIFVDIYRGRSRGTARAMRGRLRYRRGLLPGTRVLPGGGGGARPRVRRGSRHRQGRLLHPARRCSQHQTFY